MAAAERMAALLNRTKWGESFSPGDIATIAGYMSVHEVGKGTVLFKEGDDQRYMAFIVEGEVEISKASKDNTETIVVRLSAGTHFGELSMVDGCPRSAKAKARTDVLLLTLTPANFNRIMKDHPRIGVAMLMNIARMISARLRMTTGRYIYLKS